MLLQKHDDFFTFKINVVVKSSDTILILDCFSTHFSWGGCIVALCESKENSQEFIHELKEQYYKKLPEFGSGLNLENVVFATSPQSGAEIFTN